VTNTASCTLYVTKCNTDCACKWQDGQTNKTKSQY